MKKNSIRIQIAFATICIITLTIAMCLFANMFFLERIYTKNKKQSLIETYQLLEENSTLEKLTEESFVTMLDRVCNKYNLSMIILNERNYPVLYSTMNLETLVNKLVKYQWGQAESVDILQRTDTYIVQRTLDGRANNENMEMWGMLPNGYTFLFTTPLESIAESAAVSNKFMRNIGIASVVLGGIIAWIYSGKFSEPILKLADFSEKLTKLDFEAKYSGKHKNEIGVLGNNMNRLSHALQKTISELKTANIELKQDIQKKQVMDEKRKEFIGNVSHELKTPIALIQGYAEGLREGLVIDDPENMQYYLDVICDEANRMNHMVKNLMELNELESGGSHLVVERFDIVSLVRNLISNASVLLKDVDAKIVFDAPESIFVWGDEFKVEEVVMNFLTNAIHHVKKPTTEKPQDTFAKIHITIRQEAEKAKVMIFNTGEQIPQDDIALIWDKFYKVDKARTRAYGGSGIGLSIVKAIVHSMNESCGVENVQDGVQFWFTLSCS